MAASSVTRPPHASSRNTIAGKSPISATMNADAKNAYVQAQTICAAGAPTNAIAAGVDILAIENALLPYFKKATALASNQEIGKRRMKFGNANLVDLKFNE